jgi:hypothetical protein
MTWPQTPLRTYAPGIAIEPADLNEMQRATTATAHGILFHPLKLETLVSPASWTVNSTGCLVNSTDSQTCRVMFALPVGSVILGWILRGQQAAANAQFQGQLNRLTGTASVANVGATMASSTSIVGSEQDVVLSPEVAEVTALARRYALAISTIGGGSAQRTITGAWIKYYRP